MNITVDENNKAYNSVNNCLIETTSKKLIAGCKNSIIPTDGSITSIGVGAFEGCSGLTSIIISDGVTSIGFGAFKRCSGLTSVIIPDGVTSIGYSTFWECSGLEEVYYTGTAEEWQKIDISIYNNGCLTSATRYYYSEVHPTTSGNYWHYVNGVPAKW